MSQLPIPPKPNSLDAKAFQILRERGSLTQPIFGEITGSWRLAACIHRLRGLGWPIATIMIFAPSQTSPNREIAKYFLTHSSGLNDNEGGAA